jgi:hypothetical protein
MQQKKRSTGPSRVVPHRSTTPARTCLTSLFGWEAVSQADILLYGAPERGIVLPMVPRRNGEWHSREFDNLVSFGRAEHRRKAISIGFIIPSSDPLSLWPSLSFGGPNLIKKLAPPIFSIYRDYLISLIYLPINLLSREDRRGKFFFNNVQPLAPRGPHKGHAVHVEC